MAMRDPLAVTVIGGSAGTGKSTLIGSLLADSGGHRLVAIVPRLEDVPIDPRQVVRREKNRVVFHDGSVCLSPSAGLLQTMVSLQWVDPAPCRVVIDGGSGVSPWEAAQLASLPGFRLCGIVAVTPADGAIAMLTDPTSGRATRERLKRADILVITKSDLIPDEDPALLRRQIRTLVPGPRIISGCDASVNREILSNPRMREMLAAPVARPLAAYAATGRGGDVESISWTSMAAIGRGDLEALLTGAADLLTFASGIVALRDMPGRRTVLHASPAGHALTPGEPWGDVTPATAMVFVGHHGLNKRLARPAFDSLLPRREQSRRRPRV